MSEVQTPKFRLVHSKKIRVGSVNLDTGEVLEGVQLTQRPRIKHFTQEYMIMFLKAFEQIAADKTIKQDAYRVLFLIMSRAQMKNWVQIQQQEIAEALDMKQPNVSRALKTLQEKGLIEATAKLGKAKSYRVSLDVGWRGPGKEYTDEKALRIVKARRDHLENKDQPSSQE